MSMRSVKGKLDEGTTVVMFETKRKRKECDSTPCFVYQYNSRTGVCTQKKSTFNRQSGMRMNADEQVEML